MLHPILHLLYARAEIYMFLRLHVVIFGDILLCFSVNLLQNFFFSDFQCISS